MKRKQIESVTLFQIEKTNKMVKQFSQKAFDAAGVGLKIDQWVLLKIIHESEVLSQVELARKSVRDPASITRTLDLLEKKELLERHAIEGNRRQYQIMLTKKGAAFVEKFMPLIQEQRARSTEGFSKKDLKQLRAYLELIQKNMS